MKIHILVFWVAMLCSYVVGYQSFGGSLVSCYITTRCHNIGDRDVKISNHSPWRWWQHGPPKRWCTTTSQYGNTT